MGIRKYKELFIQFIKFNLVGILNTAVDFAVFSLLTWLNINYVVAQVISYACGILNSYLFNTLWTFRRERKRTPKEFTLFLAVNIVSLGVSLLIQYLCHSKLNIESDLLAKLIATPVSMAVNFAGNKLIVFKKDDTQKDE